MKKWIKRILKISGTLLIILIVIIAVTLFFQRHTILTVYYFNTNQNAKAIPHLQKIIKDPDDLNYQLWRFYLLYPRLTERQNIIEICEMLIEDSTKLIEAQLDDDGLYTKGRNDATAIIHNNLSWKYFKNGEYEKSADEYMIAHNAKPSCPPHCGLQENAPSFAFLNSSSIGLDKALTFYNIYTQKYPDAGYAYYFRGIVYADSNDYEKALDDFDRAIELCADSKQNFTFNSYAGFFVDKAESCEKLGKAEEAIEAYRGYIKYGENSIPILTDKEVSERIKALEGIIDE